MSEFENKLKYYPKYFNPIIFLIVITFLIRLVFSVEVGYGTDVDTFKGWAILLASDGLSEFYYLDAFTDYPPLYMYVLYIIGQIYAFFDIDTTSTLSTVIIKLPAIIFDVLTTLCIYKLAVQKISSNKALGLALFFALNPAIFIDSAIWGQVDSIYTLFIALAIYLNIEADKIEFNKINKYYVFSYMLFMVGILLKPQAFIFTPLFIFAFVNYLFGEDTKEQKIYTSITSIVAPILLFIFVCLPFVDGFDFGVILKQYAGTIGQYDYMTLNAFNFYGLIGKNFADVNEAIFFNIQAKSLGTLSILFFSIVTFCFLFENRKNKYNMFFAGAFLNFSTFMFSVKMHERYLYPTLLFLFIYYIYTKKTKFIALYGVLSFTFYVNCYEVIKLYLYEYNYKVLEYGLVLISLINLFAFSYMLYVFLKSFLTEEECENVEKEKYYLNLNEPINKKVSSKLAKKDIIIICVITVLYSFVAFYNLGSKTNPNTYTKFDYNDQVVVNFKNSEDVKSISILNGTRNDKKLELKYVDKNGNVKRKEIEISSVFKWYIEPIDDSISTVTIKFLSNETYIQEIAFLDENNKPIEMNYYTVSKDLDTNEVAKIFDEPELVVDESTYMNSTYFDEIYHPRTGFEFVEKLEVYETTHPPLGKVFMAMSIDAFGMSPYFYRLPGVIFGIIMIPFIYLLAFKLFNKTEFATFATLLLTFDFMHFVQTRLATIDSFVTLFILISYYFMYEYYNSSIYFDDNKKLYRTLGLSGVFMGLSIATKWTGVYAAVGLATLFFMTLYARYKERLFEVENENVVVTNNFKDNSIKTILFCVLFFVIIPIIIYGLSYYYYLQTPTGDKGITSILENQQYMLSYHSSIYDVHPYSSEFWTWLLIVRPVYYYAHTYQNGLIAGISGFGNPFVWYMGTVAFIYTITRLSTSNRKTAIFLLAGYLSTLVPWIFVTRTTYMYHYFPSTVFMILMITNMFKETFGSVRNKYSYIYIALVIVCFIIFYPVLSGMAVPNDYVRILRWLPTWALGPVY